MIVRESRTYKRLEISTAEVKQRQNVRRQLVFRGVDSSLLLPNAARCLMKNVTRPNERDGWQIEEAIERDNETGTD